MYSKLPNLIIAFHGCDLTTFENVLYRHEHIAASKNDYDWLGNGIYFWENNLARAWQWAKDNPKIKSPAVIGAVLDLGHCLNLSDSRSINLLKVQHDIFKTTMLIANKEMPINKNISNNEDVLLRRLDCAVIENLHMSRKVNKEKDFDSVRGIFIEGERIYKGTEFREKTHVQICARNPNCIKGYFAPLKNNSEWDLP